MNGATFAVRVGTIDGVITHHLRAETRRDLATWARAIVQGCHTAALSLREYTVRKYFVYIHYLLYISVNFKNFKSIKVSEKIFNN